jgi:formate dehydrogenase subunit gamma
LFVTASFGHIYLRTIGAEGVFEGMWTGFVDAAWAQQHNDLWFKEMLHEKEEKQETLK